MVAAGTWNPAGACNLVEKEVAAQLDEPSIQHADVGFPDSLQPLSVGDDPKPGRASTSTDDGHVDRVQTVTCGNRRLTVREVADEVGISVGSFLEIWSDKFGMHRVSAKFVPRLLTDEQKQTLVEISQEQLAAANDNENFRNIVTGDETWVYGYDVETKVQSSQSGDQRFSSSKKKAHMSRSNMKVVMIVFFDYKGIVHQEFLPHGQTVNKEVY
ncbi:histone-lysine N-methyltransferase SETMAR-like [Dermacentor albipictus]|uniref:histone-lysine N-methyltransferase SETMAR-like n=1 Tax=Dermacentor albipictus TaxID=60249 RepID=UPI0038FD1628